MASEVLEARMISMIMPLQSQQMLMSGALPELSGVGGFLVGSVMDCERCRGRLPFCWSKMDGLPRMAVDPAAPSADAGAVAAAAAVVVVVAAADCDVVVGSGGLLDLSG
jgi:hypothetical protein